MSKRGKTRRIRRHKGEEEEGEKDGEEEEGEREG